VSKDRGAGYTPKKVGQINELARFRRTSRAPMGMSALPGGGRHSLHIFGAGANTLDMTHPITLGVHQEQVGACDPKNPSDLAMARRARGTG
jgi:hypothetical protein